MQRDLSYAQAIGGRAASRQAAAAAEPAGEGRTAAAGAAAGGASQQGAASASAAGVAASDRSGPADVPKLTFTIDGCLMSPTTTIFQAVEVQLPPVD